MTKKKYDEEAQSLAKAIDIAIFIFENHAPEPWSNADIQHLKDFYLETKYRIINPEPQYKNSTSLKYLAEEILTPFQEGQGNYVNLFWEKIQEAKLPLIRVNKMDKILKRKRINNQQEYDYVIDTLVPFQQEGLLSDEEVLSLNNYISIFEKKNKPQED